MNSHGELELCRSATVSHHQVGQLSDSPILSSVLYPLADQIETLATWCCENLDLMSAGRRFGYPYGICIGMSPKASKAFNLAIDRLPVINDASEVLSNVLKLPIYSPGAVIGIQSLSGYHHSGSTPLIPLNMGEALHGLSRWVAASNELMTYGPEHGFWFGLSREVLADSRLIPQGRLPQAVCLLQGAQLSG